MVDIKYLSGPDFLVMKPLSCGPLVYIFSTFHETLSCLDRRKPNLPILDKCIGIQSAFSPKTDELTESNIFLQGNFMDRNSQCLYGNKKATNNHTATGPREI